jgi:hypothetical protein
LKPCPATSSVGAVELEAATVVAAVEAVTAAVDAAGGAAGSVYIGD